MMKIYSIYFNNKESRKYQIFADVLSESIRQNLPDAEFHLIKIPAPKNEIHLPYKQICTHAKLESQNAIVQNEDKPVLFLDVDTVVINRFQIPEDEKFDIAITTRDIETHPMNSGVMYVRPTKRAKKFFRVWTSYDKMQIEIPSFLLANQERCSGYNQASFCAAVESYSKVRIKKWQCREMNLCWGVWDDLHSGTKIMHLNGRMQNAIFERGFDVPEFMKPICDKWGKIAADAGVKI